MALTSSAVFAKITGKWTAELSRWMMDRTKHDARRCNLFAHILGKTVMKLNGWKIEGKLPESRKMIVIAAPHTSNWDFLYLLAAAYSFRMSINWLGKNSLFHPVISPILKYLGGIPVDRSKRNNMVQFIADIINDSDQFTMIIPPAGTRSKTDYWKSGFYRMTLATQIPIVCGYLDFKDKVACLGLSFVPTGNVPEDMDRIREFYRDRVGRRPENTSRIRLREEDTTQD
ncbi:MAG: acyltransferase [Gammaproteobacteria bacterium]|nr:acyltransferase [Gammaproteobacteria bacterium]|tara:strand:- start:5710 stop:6396 length:687 start_codon:yes stop_codon:yes gene_type:complete